MVLENLSYSLILGASFALLALPGLLLVVGRQSKTVHLADNSFCLTLLQSVLVGTLVYYICLLINSGFFQSNFSNVLGIFGALSAACLAFNPKYFAKAILTFLVVFIVCHWPFSNEIAIGESYDFYTHWGYLVNRIVVDGVLPHSSHLYEFSTWNYPEYLAGLSLPSYIYFGSDFAIRYRSALFFVFLFLGAGYFYNQKNWTFFVGLCIATGILYFRVDPKLLPDNYYHGTADLPLTLTFLGAGIFFTSFLETRKLHEGIVSLLFFSASTQIKYDGYFLFPFFLILVILFLKRLKEINWRARTQIAIALFIPVLWVAYEKFAKLGGGFTERSLTKAVERYPQVLAQFYNEYQIFFALFGLALVPLIFFRASRVVALRFSSTYSIVLIYLGFLFYVCASEWGYIFDTVRFCSHILPLAAFGTTICWQPLLTKAIPAKVRNVQFSLPRTRYLLVGLAAIGLHNLSRSEIYNHLKLSKTPIQKHDCANLADKEKESISDLFLIRGKEPDDAKDGSYFELRHLIYPTKVYIIDRDQVTAGTGSIFLDYKNGTLQLPEILKSCKTQEADK